MIELPILTSDEKRAEINSAILKNAIHALTHTAIPDAVLGMRRTENIRVPFSSGNGFAYFVYNPLEKRIISIDYMKDEKGEMVTIKL